MKQIKRYMMYIIGIQLGVIGIVLNTRTNIGVAAFASTFYALSNIAEIGLGTASMILYMILIIFQLIILRKFDIKVLLQIPYSLVFSILTDIYNSFIPSFSLPFAGSIILAIIACLFTSLGIYFQIHAHFILTPLEGLVNTISNVYQFRFDIVKNVVDLSMVLLTVTFCLTLRQPLYGIGIGTILSAIMIGRMLKIHQAIFQMN